VVGEQRAGEAGHRAGDGECGQPKAEGRIAERFHPRLVLPDADERAAEACVEHAVEDDEHGDEEREHDVVEDDIVAEVEAEADVGFPRQAEPVLAAVAFQPDREVVHHLRKGERDHDEVHAVRAQRDGADGQRGQRGNRDGRRPGDPRAGHAFDGERADGVGADAEERGVAEAHHAAVAEDEVQAHRRDGEDQHAPDDADIERLVDRHRQQRKRQRGRKQQPRQKAVEALVDRRHARAGNRPCGRKNSTPAIST
jgi:hypothetical protein